MNSEYRRQLSSVESHLARIARDDIDDFYRAELAKLYCVELSGLLENLIRETVSSYCVSKSSPKISRYVAKGIDRFTNPDTKKILSIVGSFDPEWQSKLEVRWNGEIKDAVGSVVGNRHLIAHGRASGVSISRVSDWCKSIKKLCDFFESEIFQ